MRLAHGVGMTLGTMPHFPRYAMPLCTLSSRAVEVARDETIQASITFLEYLESFGRKCLLGSAASIVFGMVSGVIMNIVKDGQVEWLDRGIVFSAGLFLGLITASIIQWQFSQRGRGQSTAAMNIVSFVVVVAALAMVLSAPHGSNTIPSGKPIIEQSEEHRRGSSMKLRMIGCSHHTTPVEVREKFSFTDSQSEAALNLLKDRYSDAKVFFLALVTALSFTSELRFPMRRYRNEKSFYRCSQSFISFLLKTTSVISHRTWTPPRWRSYSRWPAVLTRWSSENRRSRLKFTMPTNVPYDSVSQDPLCTRPFSMPTK